MVAFIIFIILFKISFILYCCIRSSTIYDEELDDMEQEKFIKDYK